MVDTEVLDIRMNNSVTLQIKSNNKIYDIYCKNIIIPSYIKLDRIRIRDKLINLEYNLCTTYHIIFYCKISNNYKFNNSYGFYEGELIFDELTCVCNVDKLVDIDNVNQLLIFRVSRNFKDKVLKMNKRNTF